MKMKISPAQMDALRRLAEGPLDRGVFSGWGPYGSKSAPRVHVKDPTANKLVEMGLAMRADRRLMITIAGREALATNN